jgi:murein hydrolase activator
MNVRASLTLLVWLSVACVAPLHAQDGAPQRDLDGTLSATRETLAEQRLRQETVRSELAELPQNRHELAQILARDVHALYRLRRGGLLPLSGGLDALVGHASRVAHLERMAQRTLHKLEQTNKRIASLAKESVELERALSEGERKLQEIERQKASLAAEAAIAKAAAEQEAEMNVRAAAPAPRVTYGLTLVGGEQPSFSSQRGLLAMPVSGAANIAPTEPEQDGRLKGLAFEAKPGTSVRAAAGGRVAAVEAGAAGLTIIVDHGQRYQTVYSGLVSSDIEPGDAVSKSARLGSAGSEPVRFEVRRGTRNQDARSYLGL